MMACIAHIWLFTFNKKIEQSLGLNLEDQNEVWLSVHIDTWSDKDQQVIQEMYN